MFSSHHALFLSTLLALRSRGGLCRARCSRCASASRACLPDTLEHMADDSAAARGTSFEPTDSLEFGRGVSFFDAIYGFAATLLIANVDAPPAEAWRSLAALADSGVPSQLFGFALSFTVIAVFWRVNVGLMRRLIGLDAPTTILNLVAAALVILIAFTTQGISDPVTTDLFLPTASYALNIALVALAQIAMYQVARVRGLERVRSDARANRLQLLDALVTPVVFLASIPVALFLDATAAKWLWAVLIVLGPLSGRLTARTASRPRA